MVLTSTDPGQAGPAPDRAPGRLGELFDRGTACPVARLSGHGIVVARGDVRGTSVFAFAADPEPGGGPVGAAGCVRIAEAVAAARRGRHPIVGIWPSGGVDLTDGVAALAGVGPMFAAIRGASGRIPQISVVLGPAASGAAYVPAMTDVVVETAVGSDERDRQSRRADVVVGTGSAAVAVARSLVDLLGRPGRPEPDGTPDAGLAGRVTGAVDPRTLVNALLDGSGVELHPAWASTVATVLGRLGGRTIGVVAVEPGRPGERVDDAAREKARRFGRLCEAFGLPVILVVDQTGSDQTGSAPGRGLVDAVQPRITLVARATDGAGRGPLCPDGPSWTTVGPPRRRPVIVHPL